MGRARQGDGLMPIGKGSKSAGAKLAGRDDVVSFAVMKEDYISHGRVLAHRGERVRLLDELNPDEYVWIYREGKRYARGVPGWLLEPEGNYEAASN
jgi:hypothetical protein